MTYKSSISVHSIIFVALSFIGCSASAQVDVPLPLNEIREQLIRIEDRVGRLGETIDEVASLDPSRCDQPVSWNRKLPDDERFAPALNGGAYCDLETGLVWPETPLERLFSWSGAKDGCRTMEFDGRQGWHLPTIGELLSLIDERNSSPALPLGHPFKGVLSDLYWTSSPDEDSIYGNFREVYLVYLDTGLALTKSAIEPFFPEKGARAWCVRGGVSPLPISDVNLVGDEVDPYPN
jgi:uncharacterized protein DUF1566